MPVSFVLFVEYDPGVLTAFVCLKVGAVALERTAAFANKTCQATGRDAFLKFLRSAVQKQQIQKSLLAHDVTFMCYPAVAGAFSHLKQRKKTRWIQK